MMTVDELMKDPRLKIKDCGLVKREDENGILEDVYMTDIEYTLPSGDRIGGRSVIRKEIADWNGNPASFRANETVAMLEVFAQEIEKRLKCDHAWAPYKEHPDYLHCDKCTGIIPRGGA